jgi:hypothetical protein
VILRSPPRGTQGQKPSQLPRPLPLTYPPLDATGGSLRAKPERCHRRRPSLTRTRDGLRGAARPAAVR